MVKVSCILQVKRIGPVEGAGEPINGFPRGTPAITMEGSAKSRADEPSALEKWVKARRKESLQ